MTIKPQELLELIQSRRTCYRFAESAVSKQSIATCLQAAIWAPNHKLTEPWRFWVLSKAQQHTMAKVYAKLRADRRAQPNSESHQSIMDAAIEKFLKIPQVILVGQVLTDDPVTRKEDYAACACGIQNLQLMAWQMGIGVQWSTGPILQDQATYQQIGADSAQIELIGALYMGHLKEDCAKGTGKRQPLEEVVFGLN